MRPTLLLLLLLTVTCTTGCMISAQDGERRDFNAKFPDEMSFHFDTGFNRLLLFGRSGLFLLMASWAVGTARRGTGRVGPFVFAGVCVVVALGWFVVGRAKLVNYRIDAGPAQLSVKAPGEPEVEIAWERIDGMNVRGKALDVSFFEGKGQGLKWAPQWEDLTIVLSDGSRRKLNLRPLSVEQRGTLCNAIGRKAQLIKGKPTITRQ